MSIVQIEPITSTGKKYWRSLSERAGTPEFRDWVANEFPGGADLLDNNSRRNILKVMAASFGLAGLASCRRPEMKILPFSKGVEDLIPGKAYGYNTVFSLNGRAMGVQVTQHDGRPTKVEGNPNHPYSMGAANVWAQASVLSVYDPERARLVLKGGKESNWKEFDAFVSSDLSPAKLGDGSGLRILSERVHSPTLAEQRTALLAKYPKAKWVTWQPVSEENAYRGSEIVFGKPMEVHYAFDKADVVVALDSDFLCGDEPTVRSSKLFARKRKTEKPEDTLARMYSVESQFSVTGAAADHRLRMRSADVDGFATALARELGVVADLNVLGGADRAQKFLMAVVRDLKANGGKSIVIAGPRQPARVHALALMINAALGNLGQTVTLTAAQPFGTAADLKALVDEMNAGTVKALVVLGGNPVYTAPADLNFADAMKKVATTIVLSEEVDETASVAGWALPEAHYLEAWGDAVAADGTASIQQPLIAPMHEGDSAIEIAGLIVNGKFTPGYELVRATWLKQLPGDKEVSWRRALHDGVIASVPKAAEVKAAVDPKKVQLPPAAPKSSGLEIVFPPSATVYDGRFANNGWLQECPEPMTKLVWDNAALISASTAKQLGLAGGDKITLSRGGKSIEAAVSIQPGQADNSITLSLGYGRSRVGRVGTGAGFNAYALRTTNALGFGEVELKKTGGTYTFSTTQEHHSMVEPMTGKERPIVREATLEHYREHPEFAKHMVHAPELSIYGYYDYSQGYQWGMAIDLTACTGCNACVVACVAENNIPVVGKDQVLRGREMHWIRLDRYFTGDENEPRAVLQPLPCMHCETAPCESVCPVAATVHSPEGLNDMAYNRCVGTRYCNNNCPYKVRRFNFLNYHKGIEEIEKGVHNPNVTVRMRGVMEKCTYCVQRIQEKKIQAKTEGRRAIQDGELQTACQQTCPSEAIVFGNIADPASAVSRLKKQPRDYALLAEVNTKPRTTYLAKIRNPNPELEAHHG